MIYIDDLPSDWIAWSIDKPTECWEFHRWLRDLASTADPPPPLLPAVPSPAKRRRRKVTLAAALRQADQAKRPVRGVEVYPDHVTLQFGEPYALAGGAEPNEWDLDLGAHPSETRQ
jgi:hypothetical protein